MIMKPINLFRSTAEASEKASTSDFCLSKFSYYKDSGNRTDNAKVNKNVTVDSLQKDKNYIKTAFIQE